MKYIRTKDGRIVKHPHPNAEVFTFRYEIEKQANTIEELCDEFVMLCLCDGNGNKQRPIVMQDLSLLIGYMGANYGYAIYGAIWTDKGLIYVAKMKGVLPNGEIDWKLL